MKLLERCQRRLDTLNRALDDLSMSENERVEIEAAISNLERGYDPPRTLWEAHREMTG